MAANLTLKEAYQEFCQKLKLERKNNVIKEHQEAMQRAYQEYMRILCLKLKKDKEKQKIKLKIVNAEKNYGKKQDNN